MFLLWMGAAQAGAMVVSLPPDEPAEPWVDPLRLAGLAVGSEDPAVTLADHGAHWELCVSGPEPLCVEVPPPTNPQQREDVAWLARSLQQGLSLAVTPPTPPPAATPPVPRPVAPPAPPPVEAAPAPIVVHAAPVAPLAVVVLLPVEEPPPAVVSAVPPLAAVARGDVVRGEQRLAVGTRWQVEEGASAWVSGALRTAAGAGIGEVALTLDSPVRLGADPLRQSWTACGELRGLWPLRGAEVGVGLGLEHQRWWQASELVESAIRPRASVLGAACPGEGPVCLAAAAGWSLRRVSESEGGTPATEALPLDLTVGVAVRRLR